MAHLVLHRALALRPAALFPKALVLSTQPELLAHGLAQQIYDVALPHASHQGAACPKLIHRDLFQRQ
eukprot:CAMPEP_0198598710 /NCGR_PEP_ID=MMETSP1462-20131121/146020_1 /TAXON_ID=1333877 /ORGANISM="Brandtodinium nutriculum, Strain RCC3387" /LENGTH=66 /DNA_ID=CAMNT_0044330381 /DNA_START=227 /DNA_END=427 /DNA_ORIENTATION=-